MKNSAWTAVALIVLVGVAVSGWLAIQHPMKPDPPPREGSRLPPLRPAGSDMPFKMVRSQRPGAMDTSFHITAVVPASQADDLNEVLRRADEAARLVESRINHFDPKTELSRFNAAPAGVLMPLSPMTGKVLAISRQLYDQTEHAFDVTALPLITLWKMWKDPQRLPGEAEIRAACGRSRWDYIELSEQGARKSLATACFDLDGIAKGYAIDLAAEQLIAGGCVGGIVEIGGDLRCFGSRPGAEPWRAAVSNPFRPDATTPLLVLAVHDRAVCTSGDYRRFVTVQGRRLSHIVDPRTGMPVDATPSVTVIASKAVIADGWATALSVLGPPGLRLLKNTGIEAMMVAGEKGAARYPRTPGFERYVVESPPDWQTAPAPAQSAADAGWQAGESTR